MQQLLERLEALREESGMDSAEFCELVEKKAKKKTGKYIRCIHSNRLSTKHDMAIITFVNLLESDPSAQGSGVGFYNNRVLIFVGGFASELGMGPPRGKVKLEVSSKPSYADKLRGKTATPEKMIDYIVNYLVKVSKLEPSRG